MEKVDYHSNLKSAYEKNYEILNLEYFKIRDQFEKINNLYDQMYMYKMHNENNVLIEEYLKSSLDLDKGIRQYFQKIKNLHHELNLQFDDFTDNIDVDNLADFDVEKYQSKLDSISIKISDTLAEYLDLDMLLAKIQKNYTEFTNKIAHKNF